MVGSLFLARVLGIYMLVVGVALLIHRKTFKGVMEEVAQSRSLLAISGVVALIIGLLIVLSHNQWGRTWEVIISLVGWIALINGVLRLWIPAAFHKMAPRNGGEVFFVISGIFLLIIGVYLSYVGFFYSQMIIIEV